MLSDLQSSIRHGHLLQKCSIQNTVQHHHHADYILCVLWDKGTASYGLSVMISCLVVAAQCTVSCALHMFTPFRLESHSESSNYFVLILKMYIKLGLVTFKIVCEVSQVIIRCLTAADLQQTDWGTRVDAQADGIRSDAQGTIISTLWDLCRHHSSLGCSAETKWAVSSERLAVSPSELAKYSGDVRRLDWSPPTAADKLDETQVWGKTGAAGKHKHAHAHTQGMRGGKKTRGGGKETNKHHICSRLLK